jgi:ATP-binding cassette, subfamily C (CFTR/MRP), member 1
MLTENLTNNVEANFYARCPPDKRPALLHTKLAADDGSETQAPSTDEKGKAKSPDPEKALADVTLKAQKRSCFRMKSRSSDTDAKVYDSSFVKALHATFWFRWWGAGLLKLLAGVCSR